MLGERDAMATVGVKDMKVSKKFYGETLGLKEVHAEGEGAATYQSGSSRILVYRSTFAGTNRATAVTWEVGGGIEELVGALKERGVSFEHYDLPGTTRKGDLHVQGSRKLAWFQDPDGNIHALFGQ